MEIDGLVLCLSITKTAVHFLLLDDPLCVLTLPPCRQNETFVVGKWYKKQTEPPRRYKPVEQNIVPTEVWQIDYKQNKVSIELVLPVFIAPNFLEVRKQFAKCTCIDSDSEQPPLLPLVCPLFGANNGAHESWEFFELDQIKWPYGDPFSYSDKFYALKVNLEFTVGKLPKYTLSESSEQPILQPWNNVEYPIIERLCGPCTIGLVVEERAQKVGKNSLSKTLQHCLLLNKQSELSIAVFPYGKFASVGQFVEYWPINLNCYQFPVTIALECPNNNNGGAMPNLLVDDEFCPQIKKVTDKFYLELHHKIDQFKAQTAEIYSLKWLGNVWDPFGLIIEGNENDKESYFEKEKSIVVQVCPTWHMPKKSVAWTVCAKDDHMCMEQAMTYISSDSTTVSKWQDDSDNNDERGPLNSIANGGRISMASDTSLVQIIETTDGGNVGIDSDGLTVAHHHQSAIIIPNQQIGGTIKRVENVLEQQQLSQFNTGEINNSNNVYATLPLNGGGTTKHGVAALVTMTIIFDQPYVYNDAKRAAVLLLWDEQNAVFTPPKLYAIFDKIFQPHEYGQWYELTYVDVTNTKRYIDVLEYKETEKRCVTRNRNEICAQFYLNGGMEKKFLKSWHLSYPCKYKSYYKDGDWCPWLCTDCFPGLPESMDAPPPGHGQREIAVTSNAVTEPNDAEQLDQFETQIRTAFSLEEEEMEQGPLELEDNNNKLEEEQQQQLVVSSQLLDIGTSFSTISPFSTTSSSSSSTTFSSSSRTSSLSPFRSKPSTSAAITKPSKSVQKPSAPLQYASGSSSPTVANQKEEVVIKAQQHKQIASSTSLQSLTNIPNNVVEPTSRKKGLVSVLAVYFAIRETDSVFLFWDEKKRELSRSIYANSLDGFDPCPLIGGWYWIEYRMKTVRTASASSQIRIQSIKFPAEIPRVETRATNGICAQFKGTPIKILTWHRKNDDNRWCSQSRKSKRPSEWWPMLCANCFPAQQQLAMPINNPQIELKAIAGNADTKLCPGAKTSRRQQQQQRTGKSADQEWSTEDDSTSTIGAENEEVRSNNAEETDGTAGKEPDQTRAATQTFFKYELIDAQTYIAAASPPPPPTSAPVPICNGSLRRPSTPSTTTMAQPAPSPNIFAVQQLVDTARNNNNSSSPTSELTIEEEDGAAAPDDAISTTLPLPSSPLSTAATTEVAFSDTAVPGNSGGSSTSSAAASAPTLIIIGDVVVAHNNGTAQAAENGAKHELDGTFGSARCLRSSAHLDSADGNDDNDGAAAADQLDNLSRAASKNSMVKPVVNCDGDDW